MVEVFRFMVTRPPQRQDPFPVGKSRAGKAMRNAIAAHTPPGASEIARIAAGAEDRAAGLGAVRSVLDTPIDKKFHAASSCLDDLATALRRPDIAEGDTNCGDVLRQLLAEILRKQFPGQTPDDIAAQFDALRNALADRLLGRLIAGPNYDHGCPLDQATIIMRIRMLELISRLRGGKPFSCQDLVQSMRTQVLLPRLSRHPAPKALPVATAASAPEQASAEATRLSTFVALRSAVQRAADTWSQQPKPGLTLPQIGDYPNSDEKLAEAKPGADVRRESWTAALPATSRSALKSVGVNIDSLSPAAVLDELDERIQFLQSASMIPQQRMISTRIGRDIISSRFEGIDLADLLNGVLRPGGNAPAGGPALDSPPTVPAGIGTLGPVRRGDLEIVRQRLKRYAADEIAHIENILKGEQHERSFLRAETVDAQSATATMTGQIDERDLQSTERFELKSAMQEASSSTTRLQAGITVSAGYGPTVSIEAGTEFAADFAQEKSKEAASTFARETTSRALSRIQTEVNESRSLRSIRSMKERTLHAIDNSAQSAGHIRGIYRWVNKIYEAQLVNYGIRDLYDFHIPEPAALWRHVQAGVPVQGITVEKPEPPQVNTSRGPRPLMPQDLSQDNYLDFVARYQATDVAPPPALTLLLNAHLSTPAGGGADVPAWGTLTNTQMTVPAGYRSKRIKYDGSGLLTATRRHRWSLLFSGRYLGGVDTDGTNVTPAPELGDWIDIDAQTGTLNIAVYYNQYTMISVTVAVECQRTPEALAAWQIATFDAITMGYVAKLSAYENEVSAADASHASVIRGRNPSENEITIRNELKRSMISMMTGQRFETFDATRAPQGAARPYPELNFADAAAEGRYVSFCEQAFEWENLTFVLYPYFWGRKDGWPTSLQIEDTDPLFAQFLRAGFARAQLPVRPGFEAAVKATFAPENWSGDIWQGEGVPGFDDGGALEIADELRAQTGGDVFSHRPGFVTLKAGDSQVSLTGASFSPDDLDRELRVAGQDYRIVEVIDDLTVRIGAPLPSADINAAPYAMGAKLVGEPWEIMLPTTLVYLQQDEALNP